MRGQLKRRLGVERLEDRATPAVSLTFVGGALTVRGDNNPNNLVITQPAANQFQVKNNGVSLATLNVTGGITTLMGNSNDTVTLNLLAAPGLAGNVNVNTGNGNDSVSLGGRVGGNVMLATGLGNDLITANNNDIAVGGSLTWNDQVGTNTMDLNGRNTSVGGNLMLNGVGVFTMGAANTLNVGGTTIIGATTSSSNPLTVLFNGLATNLNGQVLITGGSQNDVLSVSSKLSIGGNATVLFKGGNNTVVLTPAVVGNGIGGSLTYLGDNGVDVVVFGAESEIDGNTWISMGEGINTFVDTPTSDYAGNLDVIGGNGTNTAVVLGAIAGNFSNTFGNGAGNTTVFTGTLGGTFNYTLGNGTLGVLTIAPATPQIIRINATFGTGDATLTLGPNVTLTGIVRGTGGSYTFNQGTATLGDIQFINFFP